MLNSLIGISGKLAEYQPLSNYTSPSDIDEPLISRAQAGLENYLSYASKINFRSSLSPIIPPAARKTVKNAIDVSLSVILSCLASDMKDLLSITGKKTLPEDNEIIIRAGDLKKDLKKILNLDADKFKPHPAMEIDSVTVCAKKHPDDKKAKIIIFLDYPSLTRGDRFAPWLVAMTHEICGHLPMILKNTIPKNRNEEEYIAYKNANRVLANIIKSFKNKGIPQETINHLEALLMEERKAEAFFKKLIKK